MKNILKLFFLFITTTVHSQIKEKVPIIELIDFSSDLEEAYNRYFDIYHIKYEDLSPIDQYVRSNAYVDSKMDVECRAFWDTHSCHDIYCSFSVGSIYGSSHLKSNSKNNYNPENAHDLSYKHVWVEGKPGYGIGEYLIYSDFNGVFNEIIIANGYVKSKSLWENNSRVKKLKMYLNDKPYAMLILADIIGNQRYMFRELEGTQVKSLKFEIVDVYKGLKHDDVVISEIFFGGPHNAHCFTKGTKITLADLTSKNIEQLNIGDEVAFLDHKTNIIRSACVEKMEKVSHSRLVTYNFKSGLSITTTQDHPFKIKDKGWASLNPYKSMQYKGFESIKRISINDHFLSIEGTEELISIIYLDDEEVTYTISKLSKGDNFFANDLVVGVEELND